MSILPEELRYLESHEWVSVSNDTPGIATVGISAFAVAELTDLVFMALPKVGQSVSAGHEFGEVVPCAKCQTHQPQFWSLGAPQRCLRIAPAYRNRQTQPIELHAPGAMHAKG